MKKLVLIPLLIFTLFAVAQEQQNENRFLKQQRIYLKAGGGFSRRIARIDERLDNSQGLRNHVEKLRNGNNLQLEAGFFISKSGNDAIALQFYRMPVNVQSKFTDNNTGAIFNWNTSERIQFIGLNWVSFVKLNPSNRIRLISRLGAGTISYETETNYNAFYNTPFGVVTELGVFPKTSENGTGFNGGLGIDYRLLPNLAIEANIDLFTGRVTINNERENLTNIAFAAALRFSL